MNNFKKFVAVLLGVVMACVFATSAFAASTSDKAAAIKSEMANYGLTGFDAVIDSLNDTQLQVLIDNRGTLEEKVSQVIAYKNDNHSAEDQVANLNSQLSSVQGILSQAGITATMSVSVNGNTGHGCSCLPRLLRLTALPRSSLPSIPARRPMRLRMAPLSQRCCQQCRQEQCCRFQRQDRFFRCEPHHRFFQRCHQGHRR